MKKLTKDLQIGDELVSGEKVLSFTKLGRFNNVKALVTLKHPLTGRVRIVEWGWFGTIFLRKKQ